MSSSDQGLKKTERLERKAEFERVYKQGRRLSGEFFIAYVLSKPEGPLRLGVVASRKVGAAVTRNRAKRLMREAFRKNRPEKAVAADIVLIARASICRASYRDVENAYVRVVSRAIEKAGESSG